MSRFLTARLIFYLVLLFALDECFLPSLRMGGAAQPVLVYLMVVYAALKWPWQRSLLMAAMVGLLRDAVGPHPLGVETAAMVTTSIALHFLVQAVDRDFLLMRFLVAFLYALGIGFFIWAFSGMLAEEEGKQLSWLPLGVIFQTALWTTAVMPVFFYVTDRWFHHPEVLSTQGLFRE